MNKWRHQRGKRKRKKGMQEKLRSLESFREWITIWWQANQFVLIINKSWGCRYHAITCLKAHVLVMLVVSIPAHLHLFMEKHEIFHWDIDVTEETEAPNVEISVTDHHWSHERLLCFYSRLTLVHITRVILIKCNVTALLFFGKTTVLQRSSLNFRPQGMKRASQLHAFLLTTLTITSSMLTLFGDWHDFYLFLDLQV